MTNVTFSFLRGRSIYQIRRLIERVGRTLFSLRKEQHANFYLCFDRTSKPVYPNEFLDNVGGIAYTECCVPLKYGPLQIPSVRERRSIALYDTLR